MTHTCLFTIQVSWDFPGLVQSITTCLECSLLKEQAISELLLHPALLLLRPALWLLLSCWGQQCGHHFLPAQSFPLALLRHLQPELIDHAIVAGPHVSVPDHSVRWRIRQEVKVKRFTNQGVMGEKESTQSFTSRFLIDQGLNNNMVLTNFYKTNK